MHPPMPVVDLHQDIAYYLQTCMECRGLGEDKPGRQSDLPKMERGNVRIVFGAVFTGLPLLGGHDFSASPALARYQVRLYRLLAGRHEPVNLILGRRDLDVLEGPWRLGVLVSLEGAYPLAEPWELEDYYHLGVRAVGLTWNVGNRYAQGCCPRGGAPERDYGLTGDGLELIGVANRLGVIVDVAHASRRAAVEAIEASSDPVILSHGAPGDGPRQSGHEVLQALADKGGVFGVTFIPKLYRDPSLDTIADTIVSLIDAYGHRLPAIGSDFHGISSTPRGLESVDKLPSLARALLERGLSKGEVEAVMYGNALRVLRQVLR